ncbi:MAG: hypothetical protein RMK18_12330 [Armatimonadota bacterium]|nr:hypothetical protein [Armatimonadota bacterium]MCX7777667.1 hypothetical protein [Armatimonadota bacterium]MDW8026633.1 hypothetical protein [Armatimonadota bacterium]
MFARAYERIVCAVIAAMLSPIYHAVCEEWKYHAGKAVLPTVSVSVNLKDDFSGRNVPLRITLPQADGKYPLIVWSHGAFGSKDGYEPLVHVWASSGYVVIQPTHSDSLTLMTFEERQKVIEALSQGKFPFWTLKNWRERVRDISFLLDSLAKLCELVTELKVRMDESCIGVGGHSFGAFTTQLVAGSSVRTADGRRITFSDERPKAFIAISPTGADGIGIGGLFDKHSFEGVNRPMLLITGSNDLGRGLLPAEWRKTVFEFLPEGDKYLLWIEEAYHDFGGISGIPRTARKWFMPKFMGGENERHLEIVRSMTLAFWDAYLKGKDEARKFIASKLIEQANGVELRAK